MKEKEQETCMIGEGMAGLADMYQDYIDGKREIRDINMAFRAGYESGVEGPERPECGYYQR